MIICYCSEHPCVSKECKELREKLEKHLEEFPLLKRMSREEANRLYLSLQNQPLTCKQDSRLVEALRLLGKI